MKRIGKAGKKKVLLVVAIIACLWILISLIDFSRVHGFERPIFCILSAEHAMDDGGSGTYMGLGYSFEIKGNFMPEDELPGVTEYTARVLNISVMSGIRD